MQDNRHLDVGIVVVLRHEQQVGTGREASNARLQNGYYIARMSAKAFTGVLDPAAVCGGPFAHIDDARTAMERLKSKLARA